jgi:hypothetical protein
VVLRVRALLFTTKWRDALNATAPLRKDLREALLAFRTVLLAEGVYSNAQNLQEATNSAIDCVDFLLEGPHALKGRKGPRRSNPWRE